ncbi:exodeoxyribonuclease III [Rhodospirillum rubrum]|uniref:exodeoxyribonuclease III n=1 Tax=Rhodospirillum rubrum TaxID=1085 RepID=UPI001907F3A4|nr:exodeoxyribonuclease III [Rhodospirillum rubrum]MBK1663584.1 exodeoxyribonuclease III [Rhodospirillum rubrum]MBK1677407.1 exodeoxyribonuclease III [Rhodospirillum rubrum]
MVSIATFNVNSVKARLPNLLDWLGTRSPDVALLQEIKCLDDTFPRAEIEALGYRLAVHGQKAYNGVAILSRLPLSEITARLPGLDGAPAEDDDQARYLEAVVDGRFRICCLYLPNGNPVDEERKFGYKLAWMDRLIARATRLMRDFPDTPVILGGDFNVCPDDLDVYDPVGWANDALCRPETRQRFRALLFLGYTDALRALNPGAPLFTFWDYQAGAWQKDHGLRIDHLLLNPAAADRLSAAGVDRATRGQAKSSDHAPSWVTLEL